MRRPNIPFVTVATSCAPKGGRVRTTGMYRPRDQLGHPSSGEQETIHQQPIDQRQYAPDGIREEGNELLRSREARPWIALLVHHNRRLGYLNFKTQSE